LPLFRPDQLVNGESMTAFPGSHRDLLDADVATLATIDGGGVPQLTAVWFLHDEGELRLSLNSARAKTKNLGARPVCSLLVLDLGNPYRYLEVRGHARVEPDADYTFADKVGRKYGADLREIDRPGETRVVVTIEPERMRAVDMSG
jgi:PPOX class probable F420-dependent enzyme